MKRITNFLRNEDGVTMIEYGLLAALIAVVCVVSIGVVGSQLNLLFTKIGSCLKDAAACA